MISTKILFYMKNLQVKWNWMRLFRLSSWFLCFENRCCCCCCCCVVRVTTYYISLVIRLKDDCAPNAQWRRWVCSLHAGCVCLSVDVTWPSDSQWWEICSLRVSLAVGLVCGCTVYSQSLLACRVASKLVGQVGRQIQAVAATHCVHSYSVCVSVFTLLSFNPWEHVTHILCVDCVAHAFQLVTTLCLLLCSLVKNKLCFQDYTVKKSCAHTHSYIKST